MIIDPPSEVGALKLMVTRPSPAVAIPMTGALGTVDGVTLFDAAEEAPVPTALDAATMQVTALPFANPETVIGDATPELLRVPQVAVYPVMVLPPLVEGGEKPTVTCVLLAVAMPIVGAPGTVAGTTMFEGADVALVP